MPLFSLFFLGFLIYYLELILRNYCSTISQKDILGRDAVNWKADKLSTFSCSGPTKKSLLGGDTSSFSLPGVEGDAYIHARRSEGPLSG